MGRFCAAAWVFVGSLTSLLLRWLWLPGFFGFSSGFSWVLHGFVTALAAQMLVNVGAGSPGRMLENDRVYTVYKPYKVTSLHTRIY